MNQSFEEIRVYEGVAERTGIQFDRASVRHSAGYCSSLTDLHRKARVAGDGCFYLPLAIWPAGTATLDMRKPWVVMSSVPSIPQTQVREP